MSSPRRIAAFCLAAVAGSATLLVAGPLAPPAGPVASTMKTLAEIEPRTAIGAASTPGNAEATFAITQPGSYYLTAPIAGTPGKFGIKIYASNVTIDLAGFEVVGNPGTTWAGIASGPGVANVTIRDGVLRGWGSGIDLANADRCTFERLQALGSRDQGLYAGAHAHISDCVASEQSEGGGIFAGLGCVISRCRADHNGGVGVSAGSGSTISDCSVSDNLSAGFYLDEGCTLRACSGYRNGQHGAFAFYGCSISACSFRGNTLDGIQVWADCSVVGNTCSDNGAGSGSGAGVHAVQASNRIEGNNCTGADRGIDVDAGGNFIIRNSCSANTVNFSVVAGNAFYAVPAAASTAVNGSSGGTPYGTSVPDANFSY